jgi:hypothetical protein
VIHDVLPSAPVPPFDCEIVFSTRANNPTGFAGLQLFGQGRRARFFLRAQMDVTVKCGGFKPEVQLSAQVPDVAVDKMVGKLIALMNQRIMTLHGSRFRIVIGDAREERVVLPKRGTGCPHIGHESAGMLFVKGANGGRQHEYVTGRKSAMEEQFFHPIRGQT